MNTVGPPQPQVPYAGGKDCLQPMWLNLQMRDLKIWSIDCIFIEKNPFIIGPQQFRPVLFKVNYPPVPLTAELTQNHLPLGSTCSRK